MKNLISVILLALILGGCGYLPGDDDDDDNTPSMPGTLVQVGPDGTSVNTPTTDGSTRTNCQLNLAYEGTTFTPCVAFQCVGACSTLKTGCTFVQEEGVQVQQVSVCAGNPVASASGQSAEGQTSMQCHVPHGDEPTRQFCMDLTRRLSEGGD